MTSKIIFMKMCYNDIDIKSGCIKFESELMLLSNSNNPSEIQISSLRLLNRKADVDKVR